MKAPSPLLGFNNNVRHKGRVFHIQTEDSGVRHPHIITHLFADGGRILKTTKTSYAEHIGQDRMAETVRGMMQEQHKAMFIALRDGQFDYLFDENASHPAAAAPAAAAPAATAPVAPPPPSAPKPAPTGHVAAAAKAAFIPPSTSQASMPAVQADAIRGAAATAATASAMNAVRPSAAAIPAARPSATGMAAQRPIPRQDPPPAPTPAAPPVAPPPMPRKRTSRPKLQLDPAAVHARPAPESATIAEEPSIDLDLDALERAAAEAQTPFFQQIQDLPPPPAAVLGNKMQRGGYSVRQPTRPNAPAGLFEPPPPRRSTPPIPPSSPSAPPPARYAPSRPAAIFATTRPPEGASIFGEDLISEKSLDEVILSYLAEDLEGPIDKK